MNARVDVKSLTHYELFYNYWRQAHFCGGQFDGKVRQIMAALSQEIVHRNLQELRFHSCFPIRELREGDAFRFVTDVRNQLDEAAWNVGHLTVDELKWASKRLSQALESLRAAGP